MNKKGVSPVIATVLLIGIVVVIAVIIFVWFKGFTEEAITKFGDKNIKLVCGDVKFEAEFNAASSILSISNNGNIPIYNLNVQITSPGSHLTDNLKTPETIGAVNWPVIGLNQGQSFASILTISPATEEIILIPILIGKSKEGEEKYECEEKYGVKVLI